MRFLRRKAKFAFQKIFRGYPDCEWWDFSHYYSKWCLPRLKHLRKHYHGGPKGMYPEIQTWEDWERILDQMIEGFEANIKLDNMEFETKEDAIKLREKLDKGIALFAKYYWHLWD
jgi:hypothetical protein